MFTFPKSDRLLVKNEFKRTLDRGTKVLCQELVVFGYCGTETEKKVARARLGLIVSGKVGNAVTRNKIKRALRETFRHIRPKLKSALSSELDIVVIARQKAAEVSGKVISLSFKNCLERLFKKFGLPSPA